MYRVFYFFFFKQKTAYEMRISDWSSDVCSSDLQNRSGDNAVTQAEDAFGVSIGRETLGIYSSSNARGFSPSAAGNVRVEGLYFDPVYLLTSILADSVSVKVGLSAQSYPFAAPSGIVDFSLRRPADKAGQSFLFDRSEERRVGKRWASTCRTWGSP